MPETKVIPANGGLDVDDGSPEGHVAKMLAMSAPKEGEEGYVAPTGEQKIERPDDIPEKFWDSEKGEVNIAALLKSQADGEAALRGQVKPEPKEGEEGYVKPEPKEGEEGYVAPNQTKAVEAASAEWSEKGTLSDETYTALEGVGLSKDMVNDYIAGQSAIISTLQASAYEPFDGQEGYTQATTWAAENLSEDEIKAFDVQLTSTNPAIVAQGSKALAAKYKAEADHEPDTLRGGGNGASAGDSYKSSREMMKDMNSSKYRTSEAFRKEVAQKLGRSNL